MSKRMCKKEHHIENQKLFRNLEKRKAKTYKLLGSNKLQINILKVFDILWEINYTLKGMDIYTSKEVLKEKHVPFTNTSMRKGGTPNITCNLGTR